MNKHPVANKKDIFRENQNISNLGNAGWRSCRKPKITKNPCYLQLRSTLYESFSYYQCQKQYYTYLLKVLAKDKYISTYLIVIYVLTSSTMSVDVYSACVEFEFQNET